MKCPGFSTATGTKGESAEPEPAVDFDQDSSFTKITKLAQSFCILLSFSTFSTKLTRNMATAGYSHATRDGGMLTDVNVHDESLEILSTVGLAPLTCLFCFHSINSKALRYHIEF